MPQPILFCPKVKIDKFNLFNQICPQLGYATKESCFSKCQNPKICNSWASVAKNVKILNLELFNQICPQQGYATAESRSPKCQNSKFCNSRALVEKSQNVNFWVIESNLLSTRSFNQNLPSTKYTVADLWSTKCQNSIFFII